MNKITNFTKQVLGFLTGDKDAVIAAKNEKKANSAVDSNIANLKGEKVDAESKVEEAREALKIAKFPTKLIDDRKAYIDGIISANKRLAEAQDHLDAIDESLAFFTDLKAEFAEEIDA